MGRKTSFAAAVLLVIVGLSGCVPREAMVKRLARSTDFSPREIKRYQRFARRHVPSDDAYVALERLAEPCLRRKDWQGAAQVFESYLPFFGPEDPRLAVVIELLEAPEEGLAVSNLGDGVNTAADEALPVPTADDRWLYFTGKERPDSRGGEDIFVSESKQGFWQTAHNLGYRVNSGSHESANSVSADGNRLILLANYPGSFGGGDNFTVEKTRLGWSMPEHFPRPLNTIYFDSDGFETADGKALLFTSDRPGNLGGFHPKGEAYHGNYWGNTDIYVSLKTDTGWGDPINLGPSINTPFAERSPFLHPDGKTLYFSSDGHPGLGRTDVFCSTRLSDTSWTCWSEPRNLGREINTPGDDWGYKVATSGEVAYFAAHGGADSYGGYDIYAITLPGAARPKAVARISGRVADPRGNPLEAAIKWENLGTGENAGELSSDPADGSYFIVLPLGSNYGYYAEREGYYPIAKNLDLKDSTRAFSLTEDIVLVRIEEIREGVAVRINNIFFDFDKAELKPESYPELERLTRFLAENPDARIEIAGHTDDRGTDAYNLELSAKRAQAVVDYLASEGIPKERLEPKGYGEEKPVASNETDEGRAQNRRVEFRFVK